MIQPIEEQRICDNCVWVKKLERYHIVRAKTPWAEVVTLFCNKWRCYVHRHDGEKCTWFEVNK